jgi:predicted nucleic acid-binding protein
LTPVLLDTGVIVAWLDRSERHHQRCAAVLAELEAPLATCEAVIAESCYLLRGLRGAAAAVLENVARGVFRIPFRLDRSAPELKRIMTKYADRRIDLADACLIHLASELRTGDILTLDRDFEIYRWGSARRFRNLVRLTESPR